MSRSDDHHLNGADVKGKDEGASAVSGRSNGTRLRFVLALCLASGMAFSVIMWRSHHRAKADWREPTALPQKTDLTLDFFGHVQNYRVVVTYPDAAGEARAHWRLEYPAGAAPYTHPYAELSGPVAAEGTLSRVQVARLWERLVTAGLWSLDNADKNPHWWDGRDVTPIYTYMLTVKASWPHVSADHVLRVNSAYADDRHEKLVTVILGELGLSLSPLPQPWRTPPASPPVATGGE